jgi:hypothetical protein
LTLHFLPGYAPELNPDELVWSHMKRTGIARTPLRKGEKLQEKIEAQLAAIRKMPSLVRAFFKTPECRLYYRLVSNKIGIHRVRALNHAPVVFVLGGFQGVEAGDPGGSRMPIGGMGLVEEAVHRKGAGQGCCLLEEGATAIRMHTVQCMRLCRRIQQQNARKLWNGALAAHE